MWCLILDVFAFVFVLDEEDGFVDKANDGFWNDVFANALGSEVSKIGVLGRTWTLTQLRRAGVRRATRRLTSIMNCLQCLRKTKVRNMLTKASQPLRSPVS